MCIRDSKGAEESPTLEAIHQKVEELNNHILPEGVKVIPMLDRSDLLHYTLHTVLHNLGEGMILVTIILFLFLGNVRGAFILSLIHISAQRRFVLKWPIRAK